VADGGQEGGSHSIGLAEHLGLGGLGAQPVAFEGGDDLRGEAVERPPAQGEYLVADV